jgi:hypothetical protein
VARPSVARVCAAALWLLAGAAPARGHHSFAAEFDARRPITLDGAIAVVEWVNPHSMLWIDVRDPAGALERWGIELAPPNGLLRRGVRRTMLQPGARIIVRAFPARDGRRLGSVQSFTLSNGLHVRLDPSGESAPPAPAR